MPNNIKKRSEKADEIEKELKLKVVSLEKLVEEKSAELKTKNREIEIEAALEKVRARTMTMKRSDELAEISYLLDIQVRELGIQTRGCAFNIYGDDNSTEWFSSDKGTLPSYKTPRENIFLRYYEARHSGDSLYIEEFSDEECIAHYEYLMTIPVMGDGLKQFKENGGSFPSRQIDHVAFFKYGYLLFITLEPVPEAHNIFKRFAKVFEQTYKRFLDLQRAEAQTREAEIEASLERVRAASMSMRNSKELKSVVSVVFNQFASLSVNYGACMINIFKEDSKDMNLWVGSSAGMEIYPEQITIPYFKHPIFDRFEQARQNNESFFTLSLNRKHKDSFIEIMPGIFDIPKDRLEKMREADGYNMSAAVSERAAMVIYNYGGVIFSEEDNNLLRRINKVFEQAFTRFLDLQKVEKQAKAAEIELALERVRSQALAMKESSDLLDIVVTMRNEFIRLGHEAHYFWHMMWLPDKYEKAMTSGDGTKIGMVMELPRHIHGDIPLVADWEKSDDATVVYPMNPEAAVDYVNKMVSLGNFQQIDPQAPSSDDIRNIGGLTFIMARTTHGEIGYSLPGVVKNPPSEDIDILIRLAGAFDIAHKRFLDLKRSEEQAKEVEIELALEKVRSRSLAMHNSSELQDVINSVFERLKELDVEMDSASIFIYTKGIKDLECWTAGAKLNRATSYKIPFSDTVILNDMYNFRENMVKIISRTYSNKDKNEFFNYAIENTDFKYLSEERKKFILESEVITVSLAFTENCWIQLNRFNQIPFLDTENIILKRFAKVFEQAYTRFLDLKKAEAQAQEARIEAALEKIRSRTMAMQKGEELQEVAVLLYKELITLGVTNFVSCGYVEIKEESQIQDTWVTSPGGDTMGLFYLPLTGDATFDARYAAWKNQQPVFHQSVAGKVRSDHLEYAITKFNSKEAEEMVRNQFPDPTIFYCFNFPHGYLHIVGGSLLEKEEELLLIRFTKVFEQTYTRFLDLKKAENQAREAKIEMSLEKIRSRTMGMQSSDELPEVANLLFLEVQALGIPAWSCGYCILTEDKRASTCIMSSEGTIQKPFLLPHTEEDSFREWDDFVRSDNTFFSQELGGQAIDSHYSYMKSLPQLKPIFQELVDAGLSLPTYQINHLGKFSNGFLLFITYEDVPGSHDLFKRFTFVFDQTYTRFLDLKKAEAQAIKAENDLIEIKAARKKAEEALSELKTTQKQLIQSEKMASLGELTAGIAHEIQNPLNFVNNFSELSVELIEEMNEELDKGDTEEAKAIGADLKDNLSKINHHGKRAEGIVKGMLEHSKTSSGVKEPTDINALCDEYLRLAYHGLRAKDKSFNSKFETDFDTSIGKIDVVPQDLGRVILNLITNAFYVVNERATQNEEGYQPQVVVSTKRVNESVIIKVKDNGNGIPENIKEKIFQPFFTTKPTGQGTGLGLSLSYDIVKAHGGNLEVETKHIDGLPAEALAQAGTEFIIRIPA